MRFRKSPSAAPRNVFTIMSFNRNRRDVFASFKEVCREFNAEVERVDESASLERIVPRIEIGIRKSAFVIADVSELSPNVFYRFSHSPFSPRPETITMAPNTVSSPWLGWARVLLAPHRDAGSVVGPVPTLV
jgi:hypothetical protein